MRLLTKLAERLARRHAEDLYRQRIELATPQGPVVATAAGARVNFCTNDYLGLAADPRLAEAMARGVSRYGVGAGASHLVAGHMTVHRELEERLAEFTGAPRALLFSSGYMANLGLVTALAGRHTLVVADRLNHASLVDAGILSRARVRRYRHGDAADAERRLGDTGDDTGGEAMIVTDSVFSMDGHVAPLPELDALAARRGAMLVVDDAHGFGVLGDGRGARRHFNLSDGAVMMGTLGKACGVYGAFVAAGETVIEALIQFARPYIYTTALPPAVAAAALAAVDIVEREGWRRQRLADLVARFRRRARAAGISLVASETPIQPVVVGDSAAALEVSQQLDRVGFLVAAIRPPTVPRGSARLRVTLSAAHDERQVDALVDALAEALNGVAAPERAHG